MGVLFIDFIGIVLFCGCGWLVCFVDVLVGWVCLLWFVFWKVCLSILSIMSQPITISLFSFCFTNFYTPEK